MRKSFAFLLAVIIMTLCASCADRPAHESANKPPSDNTGTVYTITDYYDANGGFSALGQALDEENGEKVLTVKAGDVLIVGDHAYTVTAQSLTIPFYTQPLLDEVIDWWVDYFQSRLERDEVKQ